MPTPRREPPSRLPVSGQLRRALAESGLAVGELAALAGVDRSNVSRFLAEQRGLTLEVADRLCAALGLRLVESPGGRRTTVPKRRTSRAGNTAGRASRDVPAGGEPVGDANVSE